MSNAPSPSPSPASQRPPSSPIFFGPFEVTSQVFLTTPHTFALVNLKPLLPGHVLVCPFHPHQRLTSLSPLELTDLFSTVQRVQRMLARHYFPFPGGLDAGAFNIALQDGPEAGQTVPHVHVHVIPRIRGATAKGADTPSDELYERMAGEEGNVGGWLWDAARGRPGPAGGEFPRIEDAERRARSMGEMEEEAAVFRGVLRGLEAEEGEGR
ncbi:HIT domain-containing protein [Schizothecium vesticola]|uniref:Bis(5'-adenosyl)-triphosphatase n=1 Tax=Schizothecium vesticola TaxID=314040 RepID=A0AA40EW26_9PEZI|nr:HIT domain-containing protein [Schizothecium vesticola]